MHRLWPLIGALGLSLCGQAQAGPSPRPVFGWKCGNVGADPEPRVRIEAMIQQRDTAGIFSWLREDDLVHRVYAAEAVIRLQQEGVRIPTREAALVEKLKRSNRKVEVCSGCSRWDEKVRKALAPGSPPNNIRE